METVCIVPFPEVVTFPEKGDESQDVAASSGRSDSSPKSGAA
ncbi:hypothetical protein HCH_00227 [Hahella chejuensis KCTC 2396]|uniref:Uncharacterized protein n=1 Tax=Hahella chejuensis (strain KCTC 2396) TaxID=349521 RepID=Q2SQD2_HAHCH|nr:hypothetical protein HCH_00227 [Hahella chejuensis KCTC 2396]